MHVAAHALRSCCAACCRCHCCLHHLQTWTHKVASGHYFSQVSDYAVAATHLQEPCSLLSALQLNNPLSTALYAVRGLCLQ